MNNRNAQGTQAAFPEIESGPHSSETPSLDCSHELLFANDALQHVLQNEASIAAVLSAVIIPKDRYRIFVGFNEAVLKSGYDHIQEIHVYFSSDKITFSSNLLAKLGEIFKPFPGYLYLPPFGTPVACTSGHQTRDLHDHDFDMKHLSLLSPNMSYGRKVAQNESTGWSGKGFVVGKSNSMDENGIQGSSDDQDNELKVSIADKTVRFSIWTNIGELQMIKAEGIIKTTGYSGHIQTEQHNASSELDFINLEFDALHATANTESYHQTHAIVLIDTNHKLAFATIHQPNQSRDSDNTIKIITEKKTTNSITSAFNRLFNRRVPAPKIPFSLGRALEEASSWEYVKNLSKITRHQRMGKVWFHYDVDDAAERKNGFKMGMGDEADSRLPNITSEYRGNSGIDPHPPPPPTVDVKIASYWQLQVTEGSIFSVGGQNRPMCFNACHIVAFKMPTYLY